jgi:hypothetical protein
MSNSDFLEYDNTIFKNLKAYVPKTYTEPGCLGFSCTIRETTPGPNKRSRTPQLHENSRDGFRNIYGYPKKGYYTESELNEIQKKEVNNRLRIYRNGHRVNLNRPRAFGSLVEGANNEAARRAQGRSAANSMANNPETRPPQSYTRIRRNPNSDTRKRKKRRKTRRRNN